MATRKLGKNNIRKLTKTGGHSLGITFPIEIMRELGWKERQKLVVKKRAKKLVVEDCKK